MSVPKPTNPYIFGFQSDQKAASNDPNRIVSVNNTPGMYFEGVKGANQKVTFTTAGGQTVNAADALMKQQTSTRSGQYATTQGQDLNQFLGLSLSPVVTGQNAEPAKTEPASTGRSPAGTTDHIKKEIQAPVAAAPVVIGSEFSGNTYGAAQSAPATPEEQVTVAARGKRKKALDVLADVKNPSTILSAGGVGKKLLGQ